MENNPSIKLIRNINWEEVFLLWYKNEGETQNWINLAKERGFASWAEWRLEGYAKRFKCDEAKWSLYEISNPAKFVSTLFGGPFRTWIERHYEGEKTKQFSKLASQNDVINNHGVQGLINNYPENTTIHCLEIGNKIFTIEGSHRCCALAIMHAQKLPTPKKLTFAIGKSSLSELPTVGQHTSKKS